MESEEELAILYRVYLGERTLAIFHDEEAARDLVNHCRRELGQMACLEHEGPYDYKARRSRSGRKF